jgi:hypothetical protein
MLPNVIIAGFPKCGTTSLFKWLADHPEVVGSSVKETSYFVDPGTHSFRADANFRDHGLDGYGKFFPADSSARVILEATPQYVFQETALQQLPGLASQPKLIFILRHPAEQILSTYRYYSSNFNFLDASIPFGEFIDLVRRDDERVGRNELVRNALRNVDYDRFLSMWAARVGEARMLVYLFESIKADTKGFVQRVARDIGIDPGFYEDYQFSVENYSYKLRSYQLHQLNIRIRRLLPIPQRSGLWRMLRGFYRRFNTLPPDEAPMAERDREALQALRAEWDPVYQRLVNRYRPVAAAAPQRPRPAAVSAAGQRA